MEGLGDSLVRAERLAIARQQHFTVSRNRLEMIGHSLDSASIYLVATRVWHLVSRLLSIETFFQFFESIGLCLENFGLEKSLGIGLENIWSWKKVSILVSKILVSKKSLGIGLDEFFWSRHSVIYNNVQDLEQGSVQHIVHSSVQQWVVHIL